MMDVHISNEHQQSLSCKYLPASCFYCYVPPSQSLQSPISNVQSIATSREQIQSNPTPDPYLYNQNQWNSSHAIRKSFETIPVLSDDNRIMNFERFRSRKRKTYRHIDGTLSFKKSSPALQYYDTIDKRQQPPIVTVVNEFCHILQNRITTITAKKLTDLLDKLTPVMKNLFNSNDQEQQQLPILIDILNALLNVHATVLISVSENKFFSLLQTILITLLNQWRSLTYLPNDEFYVFRLIVKLLNILTHSNNLIPSGLYDSTLLETIANCITDIATSEKFLDTKNKHQFRYFTHLIDAYTLYQESSNDRNQSNKDIFIKLLHPVLQCLTSNQFIHIFMNLSINSNSMTATEKFFLLICPKFLISYKGSHLEQTMKNLLSVMLPQYLKILDRFVPSAHNWNLTMIRSIEHLLRIINHGADHSPTNAKLISHYLPLISHILKLINEPKFYNNLHPALSNPVTKLINTSISFLVNMIKEPTILAHIKQSHVALSFLRLTSCQNEKLILNVYTLLAYTTHEDDMKSMKNSDRLLSTIVQSLKITLNGNSDQSTQMEQLLETLKGLVQHDQIKDEIIKQNALPFLLACTDELTEKALILLYEILWCLAFFEDIASSLSANPNFLDKILTISKDSNSMSLKRAVGGLIWKLIQEPAYLKKVEKQEEEQKLEAKEVSKTEETIIEKNGIKQIDTIETSNDGMTTDTRSYQYDIMISYCHADKELTYKIYKFLSDQGFKIWIDMDNMYGPAMSAMANAVENSEFIIICMSDSYKQSAYCQAEAEYAFKCKRRLIPLIMRTGYRPDGWLGFMIGTRTYVDFGKFDFETACEKLIIEINLQKQSLLAASARNITMLDHLKPFTAARSGIKHFKKRKGVPFKYTQKNSLGNDDISHENDDTVSTVSEAPTLNQDFVKKSINQWTTSDVFNFLTTHHLDPIMPLCKEMNGRALIQLYKICITHRLRAYTILTEELRSEQDIDLSLNVYSRFLTAIEDSMQFSSQIETPRELPSVTNNSRTAFPSMPFIPAPNLSRSYDFLINTNASPLHTLQLVGQYSRQLQYLDYLRHRVTSTV
ncbi:unnamed protein product [Adineta steineri]|uniref:TIR domain-containing protein n=1 Tax=Adineta steineri TaxID=433720 RepID=A0A818YBV9_9BILA|nr:unnamed protein product [Adineta steineri]